MKSIHWVEKQTPLWLWLNHPLGSRLLVRLLDSVIIYTKTILSGGPRWLWWGWPSNISRPTWRASFSASWMSWATRVNSALNSGNCGAPGRDRRDVILNWSFLRSIIVYVWFCLSCSRFVHWCTLISYSSVGRVHTADWQNLSSSTSDSVSPAFFTFCASFSETKSLHCWLR